MLGCVGNAALEQFLLIRYETIPVSSVNPVSASVALPSSYFMVIRFDLQVQELDRHGKRDKALV